MTTIADSPSAGVETMRVRLREAVRSARRKRYLVMWPFVAMFTANIALHSVHSGMTIVWHAIICGVFAALAVIAIGAESAKGLAELTAAATGADAAVAAAYRKLLAQEIFAARVLVVGLPLFGLSFYVAYISDNARAAMLSYPLVAVVAIGLVLAIVRLRRLANERART
jgi:hypothetical protein